MPCFEYTVFAPKTGLRESIDTMLKHHAWAQNFGYDAPVNSAELYRHLTAYYSARSTKTAR